MMGTMAEYISGVTRMAAVGKRERQKYQRHRHNSNKGPWEKISGKSVGMMENGVMRNAEDMREDDDTGGGRDSRLWGTEK